MGFWSKIFGKGGSYFLEDEVAKGLGDTEYMKQAKTVRRTFPGAAGNESFEVTKQVSSLDEATFDGRKGARPPAATPSYQSSASSFGNSSFGSSSFGNSSFGSSSFGNASASTPTPSSTEPAEAAAETAAPTEPAPSFQQTRRDAGNVDTSMDMFRNMAKKVGR